MSDVRKKVLIVDDEPSIRDSLQLLLKHNFDVTTAPDGQAALDLMGALSPDLVLLDLIMPNLGGMDTLRRIKELHHDVPVIMLTGSSTVKTAVQAMKIGAKDYVNKPFDVEELTSIIVRTLEERSETVPTEPLPQSAALVEMPQGDFGPLVGKSGCMAELFSRIQQLSEHSTTVLITGESGTGKELVARQIHERSPRRSGPFVAINCAAIPESLIESELFGHERGAFTHAVERRIGHFELADGGTLFLDEIGELSLAVQVKMLRFLQEQEFYRVGRSKPIRVDVRIIAATNKQLEELIKKGQFREDLYYRINVINLGLPPLRDRYDDIEPLVRHFVQKYSAIYNNRCCDFDAEALRALVEYDWPGNVRELENVIESLMALCPHDRITLDDIPKKVRSRVTQEPYRTQVFEGSLKFEDAERMFEREMILKALKRTNFVQTRAAELLGISRRILKYKMDKLGISELTDSGGDESGGKVQ